MPHTLKLFVHGLALVAEGFGVLFIFLDSVRMDAQLHAAGFASYEGGSPLGYSAWYYHSSTAGLGLLLAGLFAAAVVLLLEHLDHVSRLRTQSPPSPPASEA